MKTIRSGIILFWNKICDIFICRNLNKMHKKAPKYKISTATLRKANSLLIRDGVSEKVRLDYNGDINIEYKTKNGLITKSFSNSDIKKAYQKALDTYGERI